jgi:all-trans-8'-apo-beta-carotenal 15,15'-oxygenase
MIDHAPFLDRALAAVPPDDSYAIDRVHGDLPAWLRGTFYVNGPARFSRGSLRYRHWLDGDGFVCAVRFGPDGVSATHRFIRTEKTIQEDAGGRALFRTFGTAFPGDRLNRGIALQSPANVSIYPFAGTLLAFGEQGLPYELDAATLETRGPFTFRGALTDISPFGAHPKRDPATGEFLNFGVSFAAAQPMLSVYTFDPGGALISRRRVPLDYPRTIHDFAVTERHVLFYLSPYLLDAHAIAHRGRTVMEALSWQPQLGSRLLVLSRQSGEQVASIPIGSCFCLHIVNGYEDGPDTILDAIEYERPIYEQYDGMPDLFANVGQGQPVRFVVDAARAVVRERVRIAYMSAPDFPSTDPGLTSRKYSEFWLLGISATGRPGRKFFDELVRADWSSPGKCAVYRATSGRVFAGEPAVVPDPSGREGPVVICPMCDPEHGRSGVAIFRAGDMTGPIATLDFRHLLPPLFHSTFIPG